MGSDNEEFTEIIAESGEKLTLKTKLLNYYLQHFCGEEEYLKYINPLIKAGADPNRPIGENETTAIYIAAFSGMRRAITLLKETGADLKIKDKFDRTALHYAAMSEGNEPSLPEVILELKEIIDPKSTCKKGLNAAQTAAEHGNKIALVALADLGTPYSSIAEASQTFFMLAYNGFLKEPNINGLTCVYTILERGWMTIPDRNFIRHNGQNLINGAKKFRESIDINSLRRMLTLNGADLEPLYTERKGYKIHKISGLDDLEAFMSPPIPRLEKEVLSWEERALLAKKRMLPQEKKALPRKKEASPWEKKASPQEKILAAKTFAYYVLNVMPPRKK